MPASNSPDGICLDTLNVTIDGNSVLGGRLGFDVFNNNITSLGKILNMFVAAFSNGEVFVVTKRSDGKLYHWEVYPTAATGWTEIQNKWAGNLHSTADRGWFYMWADRMYYFDRIGGTKWDGTDASQAGAGVWKAGIENSTGPLLAAIGGGGKDGHYHVTTTNFNTKTGEESVCSGPQSPARESRLSDAKGGIQITNWTAASAGITDTTADLNFEFNAHKVYCSLGNTERMGSGAGVEQFSYLFYLEDWVLTSNDATYSGIFRMDANIVRKPIHNYQGGQPPGARFGCWNGSQAVYLEVYPKAKGSVLVSSFGAATLAPGIMMYSIPGFPAMVPQIVVYDIGGVDTDRDNIVPTGGTHEIPTSINGLITGCGALGGSFLVFTNSSTYVLTPDSSGNMSPALADPVHGAIGWNPVVSTGSSVHAFGKDTWLRISSGGIQNAAHEAFTPTMQAIPNTAAGVAATVGGYYSHRNQVWFAVAKTGGTAGKAQRILIFDEGQRGLVGKYDPANLSTAGIMAMVELSHPLQAPIMLVALDTGVILSWPGSGHTDLVTGGDAQSYACNHRVLVGQSKRGDRLKMDRIRTSMELVPAAGVTLGVAGVQNAAQAKAVTTVTKLIPIATNAPLETRLDSGAAVDFDPKANGRMFAVEYSSTAQQGADWKVGDVIMEITRT